MQVITGNRFKLHYVVERIRYAGDFPFEVEDVAEDLDKVLGFFGIEEEFDRHELKTLQEELIPLALAEEFAEATRLATVDPLDALLS